jgi:hypothetical protein
MVVQYVPKQSEPKQIKESLQKITVEQPPLAKISKRQSEVQFEYSTPDFDELN